MGKKLNLIIKFFRCILCFKVNIPVAYPIFEENALHEAK